MVSGSTGDSHCKILNYTDLAGNNTCIRLDVNIIEGNTGCRQVVEVDVPFTSIQIGRGIWIGRIGSP
jgi:hypothetical protein